MRTGALPGFNRLLFEAGALPYDLLTRHPLWHAHCREMLTFVPRLGEGPRTVLDLGCGPGVSAFEMRAAEPQNQVVGLDLSWQMVKRAGQHRRARGLSSLALPLLQGDVTRLPFKDACAEGVTGHSFLYLLPDKVAALAEMKRVLKPGGALVLLEPAAGGKLRSIARLALEAPHFALTTSLWRIASRAAGRYTPATLQAALEQAGFDTVTAEPAIQGFGIVGRGIKR